MTHHLRVDATGTLVDNHQGYIVLAKFPGDGAKNGLRSDLRRQEFVGFLDENHQRTRIGALPTVGQLLAPHPFFVYAASQQVADQYVGCFVPAVLPKFQHHMISALQVFHDAAGGVCAGSIVQKLEPLPGAQSPVQGCQRRRIDTDGVRQVRNIRAAQHHKLT